MALNHLKSIVLYLSLTTLLLVSTVSFAKMDISPLAKETAQYAAEHYQDPMINTLATLVSFNTVAKEGVSVLDNPTHIAFKHALKAQAEALGFDYKDDGYLVIIGLGDKNLTPSEQRIGVITHGDVQPVDASKWAQSPFKLDSTSEPGKLLGRGTEDDKGPIASVLYAMKAIKDQQLVLSKRIELYVYLAEESDWDPIRAYVKTHDLPAMNITLDANYPVVSAEKGYGTIKMTFPEAKSLPKNINNDAYIKSFTGGFFGSQIPEDAKIVIANGTTALLERLMNTATKYNHTHIDFKFTQKDQEITITALGVSAHSSTPEDGVNAITYIADLLSFQHWPNTAAGALVNFINDNLGTDLYGSKFGNIAYSDNFMGKMTVSATVLKQHQNAQNKGIELNINLRRPKGKSKTQLETEINTALRDWQAQNNVTLTQLSNYIGEPWVQDSAPQVPILLAVFSHYSGVKNAKPIAIGGGTNSRLFPHAVSFGPSMPNTVYTGHSEHEFITTKQLFLNLKMYTAALIELAK